MGDKRKTNLIYEEKKRECTQNTEGEQNDRQGRELACKMKG